MDEALKPGHRRDAGQALVEFALVAPLLIIIVLGAVELAGAWRAFQAITDIAREVNRNAVASTGTICDAPGQPAFCGNPPPGTLEGKMERIAIGLTNEAVGLDTLNLAFNTDVGGVSIGDPVTVNLAYEYRFFFAGGLVGVITGSPTVTLKTSFVMRKEG